jgi:hypothetical protein
MNPSLLFCYLIVLCLILPAGFLCLWGIEKTMKEWPFSGE